MISEINKTAATSTPAEPKGTTNARAARRAHVAPKQPRSGRKATSAKKAHTARRKATAGKGTPAARKGTKAAKILALLQRPGGATAKELLKATGWLAHSLRGFLSGTVGKKMGLTVVSVKGSEGGRVYSVKP